MRRRFRDVRVTARTVYKGRINDSPLQVEVVARFNTGRGGRATCRFTELPTGFNPATLGTQT